MLFTKNTTYIMGVLNVTPDSFFDGGKYNHTETAVQQALQMIAEGADIIDIGGESSRPGAEKVSAEQELERVLEIVKRLSQETTVPISIDTYKPEVAHACLRAGAKILNDITGLTNPEMVSVAKEFHVPVVLMHMQGTPQTMQTNPTYTDVVQEIKKFFLQQIEVAKQNNITDIILDPGIGFGKTLAHNLEILHRLDELTSLPYPILIGLSRKSFIGKLDNDAPAEDRLPGTIAGNILAYQKGANIFRVHDVAACRQALRVVGGVEGSRELGVRS